MQATLLQINEFVEEEVVICICGLEIVCFAGVCLMEIRIGEAYEVRLEAVVFDNYSVDKSQSKEKFMSRIGSTFAYNLNGELNGKVLNCGVCFEDDILMSDFGYLEGEFISFVADRIDVEFLSAAEIQVP
jgi:hypothetical protein